MDTCSFCRGPFHIESGNIVGRPVEYRLCGACVHEMKGWLRGHLNRKWSKESFYANATVPAPAVEDTYVFTVLAPIEGRKHHFRRTEVEKSGVTFEEALIRLGETHPGHCIREHMRGLWRKK